MLADMTLDDLPISTGVCLLSHQLTDKCILCKDLLHGIVISLKDGRIRNQALKHLGYLEPRVPEHTHHSQMERLFMTSHDLLL